MASITGNLAEQAMSLPVEERVWLAEILLHSLNAPVDPEIEAAWIKEAEARRDAVLSGVLETVSCEDVISRVRKRRTH